MAWGMAHGVSTSTLHVNNDLKKEQTIVLISFDCDYLFLIRYV